MAGEKQWTASEQDISEKARHVVFAEGFSLVDSIEDFEYDDLGIFPSVDAPFAIYFTLRLLYWSIRGILGGIDHLSILCGLYPGLWLLFSRGRQGYGDYGGVAAIRR
ncbi:hypothetical protein BPOR_0249g00150 [Botrytis porri]|uniref:Uncharacterized protein n=1 Tax=Botrytis porri TaxID=87229 RepID=A0A4Z1KT94_9HELO|nr:hypothetical protein BPOR_0249g00150 [Botrytis porri]